MPSQDIDGSEGSRDLHSPLGHWISLGIQFITPASVAACVHMSVSYVCITCPVLESEMGSGIEYASETHGSEPMATFTGLLWCRQRGCQADTAECLAYYNLSLLVSSCLCYWWHCPLGFRFVSNFLCFT